MCCLFDRTSFERQTSCTYHHLFLLVLLFYLITDTKSSNSLGEISQYNVTWSRGMSLMSLILILSYRLKEETNSNVLHCLEIQRFAHISGTRCRIVMGFGSNCRIRNEQVDYIESSKLNIADMWLIFLDRVTCCQTVTKSSYIIHTQFSLPNTFLIRFCQCDTFFKICQGR